jgi:UDP-glucose 4-epimerase
MASRERQGADEVGAILVTGGAGYIGSHIVRILAGAGEDVVVIDDLSKGHRSAIEGIDLVEADFGDRSRLRELIAERGVEFIVHMAAFCEVGESVERPALYYRNNVTNSLAMLDVAREEGVKGIIFSSTAAVYGEPRATPIGESHPKRPTNPYGDTKLAIERALEWHGAAYDLNHVSLRYFNAAGAHPDGSIGEDHEPESHLIPRLLLAALRDSEPVPLFGDDYPTADGTCVRDYIHVVDLAEAHVLALQAMRSGAISAETYNLGNGKGFSVREVVDAVERVTGRRPPTISAPRRAGDPATLVASSERIRAELGWNPAFPSLERIVQSAWQWHSTHPKGYDDCDG